MARLLVDPALPALEPVQSLTGWRREFCVELLGQGEARVFVRAVEASSFKATELQRGVLFQRIDPRFDDVDGCVAALRTELDTLADTALRIAPDTDHLYATLSYDRVVWGRVQLGLDRWARRVSAAARPAVRRSMA